MTNLLKYFRFIIGYLVYTAMVVFTFAGYFYLIHATDSSLLVILYIIVFWFLLLLYSALLIKIGFSMILYLTSLLLCFTAGIEPFFPCRMENWFNQTITKNISVNDIDQYKSSNVFYFSDGVFLNSGYVDQSTSTGRRGTINTYTIVIPIVAEISDSKKINVWLCTESYKDYKEQTLETIWHEYRSGYELRALGDNHRQRFEKVIGNVEQQFGIESSENAKLIIASAHPEKERLFPIRVMFTIILSICGLGFGVGLWVVSKE